MSIEVGATCAREGRGGEGGHVEYAETLPILLIFLYAAAECLLQGNVNYDVALNRPLKANPSTINVTPEGGKIEIK